MSFAYYIIRFLARIDSKYLLVLLILHFGPIVLKTCTAYTIILSTLISPTTFIYILPPKWARTNQRRLRWTHASYANRLPPLIPGGLLMPIGLFWYGWSAQYKAHWIVPIIGTVFLSMGMITMFMPVGTYL